jgi:2'-5' RNA ligase
MHGVVSLLDEQHTALVEELWAEIQRRFGLRGQYQTPFPHFSYQVAAEYDLALLAPTLRAAAREIAPFRVRTTGPGLFERPVLYIAVERDEALLRAHERIWRAGEPAAGGLDAYYRAESWVPHITLSMHDLTPSLVPAVWAWLGARDLRWEFQVNELALIYDTGERHDLRLRTSLAATGAR